MDLQVCAKGPGLLRTDLEVHATGVGVNSSCGLVSFSGHDGHALRTSCIDYAHDGELSASQEPITLREQFPADYQYHVHTQVDLKGELSVPVDKDKPPQVVKMHGNSVIDYDERILLADGKKADQKSIRQYRTIDFHRMMGDRLQEMSRVPT